MTDITSSYAAVKPSFKSWYALFIFFLVYTTISIDRSILSVMIEPIKREFQLNDTQVGFLTGIAFALFFGIAGLPIGRWCDRANRKFILSASLFVFSLMTFAAGVTSSFMQLLATRLIVGAGEAGGGPSSISMLSDHFPRERRTSAISLYYLGSPVGSILIFLFGGMLVAAYGWRSGFLVAGAFGIALAILILLTIDEPQRRNDAGKAAGDAIPFKQTIAFIRGQKSLLNILVCGMITSAVASGMSVWVVSFLMRSHGMDVKQAGTILSVSFGGAGLVGVATSGLIVDWLGRRDVRWRGWYCMVTQLIGLPMFMIFVLSPSVPLAVAGLAIWYVMQSSIYAPTIALCQGLVGTRMRGSVMAVYYFVANFVGFGLGPQVIGIASDLLRPYAGVELLRYALIGFSVLFLWAAFHYFRAGRTLERDFTRAVEAG